MSIASIAYSKENPSSQKKYTHGGVKSLINNAMQKYKDMQISQSISTEMEKTFWVNKYSLRVKRFWKARFWHKEHDRDKEKERNFDTHVLGGGVENPFIVSGNFYEYGAYKYFGDASNMSAWSTEHNQYTKWSVLSSPKKDAPHGIRLSLPYTLWNTMSVNSYNPIISVGAARFPQSTSSGEILKPTYMWDANMGYKFIFDIANIALTWEPRVLYRNSIREEINFESSTWDSWIISTPINYQLHQLILSQKIRISKYLWVQMLNGLGISDNYKTSYFINTVLGVNLNKFVFSIQAGKFSPNSITDEWKFQKFLWSTSGEVAYYYMSSSYVKAKTKIAEYNQKNYIRPYPQSLYKMHSISAVQNIEKLVKNVRFVPRAEFSYSYSEYDEYYKNKIEISIYHHGFVHNVEEKTYWYIDEKSRRILKYTLNPSVMEQYTFSFMPLTIFVKGNWLIEVSEDYPDNMKKEMQNEFFYDTTKSFTATLGVKLKYKGFYFAVQIAHEISEDSEEKEKKLFKSETLGKLKIQYNW